MNKWEDVLTLLKIADRARQYPQLKVLHDQAVATLGAVDPNALSFYSQGDQDPPQLEDLPGEE